FILHPSFLAIIKETPFPGASGMSGSVSGPFPSRCSMERPVRLRTRTFRTYYLSFAGTYQCNLSCPHCCVPIECPDRLPIPLAVGFLESAHAFGIRTIGFTGGEPFLYTEFLLALTSRAAEMGFRFDKVMTNGV